MKYQSVKSQIAIVFFSMFGISIFFAFLFCLIFFLLPRFFLEMKLKIYSPNGVYYFQVSESNGGATTGYITDVILAKNKKNFVDSILTNKIYIFASNGPFSSISPRWINDKTLQITYSNCSKIYRQNKKSLGINIIYKGKCQEGP